ncbi:MAG: phosphatidylglycerol lysyltransferase domain-containing protein [Lachnoclostridium sp.]|nr:phosphatidylglycerol lysyltransferase domain-containing protein [Lachnoclostridium sp.]
MRPLVSNSRISSLKAERHTAASRPLQFRKITPSTIPILNSILQRYNLSRTCDYTIGGILMWVDYFHYSYDIVDDTLFLKGVSEDDNSSIAFAVPVGAMPLNKAIGLLKEYCELDHIPLRLSAVPEELVTPLEALGFIRQSTLSDWGDYLYDIEALATLAGKKLNKKRNHVNRFKSDNPEWVLTLLTADLLPEVRDFYVRQHLAEGKPESAEYERRQVMKVLDHYGSYPFTGAVLSTPTEGIVAFAIGETIGDTLYVHIEKMNHLIPGAGEMICQQFAAMMLAQSPSLRYENREEDAGDPGLRAAKLSLHPLKQLTKYDLLF